MTDDSDDDAPPAETAIDEDGSVSAESPAGDIAQAWLEEFDEELTWGDLAKWLGETG